MRFWNCKKCFLLRCMILVMMLMGLLFRSRPGGSPDNTAVLQERDARLFMMQAKSKKPVSGKLAVDVAEELERQFDMEYEGLRRRLPSLIIIGASKCSTEALQFFLAMHPNISTDTTEINFFSFDDMYKLGYNWFRNQMPASSRGQITLQRGTGYFDTPGVPQRILAMNSSVKLILCACNPVRRVLSYYTHYVTHGRIEGHDVSSFYETFFKSADGTVKEEQRVVASSDYARLLTNWLKWFNRSQIHVMISDHFRENPVTEIRKIEDFLSIGHYIGEQNIVYNTKRMFYCRVVDGKEECLGDNKGRTHIEVPDRYILKLNSHFNKTNHEFLASVGEKLDWRLNINGTQNGSKL